MSSGFRNGQIEDCWSCQFLLLLNQNVKGVSSRVLQTVAIVSHIQ